MASPGPAAWRQMFHVKRAPALAPAKAARLYRKTTGIGTGKGIFLPGSLYELGRGVERDRVKAAELIALAIKKADWVADQAAFPGWSEAHRTELQCLLKAEGVHSGLIDGEASEALKQAVHALAVKNKPVLRADARSCQICKRAGTAFGLSARHLGGPAHGFSRETPWPGPLPEFGA